MAHRLEFRPEASADVAEAFAWYESRQSGLGGLFEADLDRTLQQIAAMPEAGRIVHRTLRRGHLRRFPFAVYYVVDMASVVIRGVLHTSRHPREWRRRA